MNARSCRGTRERPYLDFIQIHPVKHAARSSRGKRPLKRRGDEFGGEGDLGAVPVHFIVYQPAVSRGDDKGAGRRTESPPWARPSPECKDVSVLIKSLPSKVQAVTLSSLSLSRLSRETGGTDLLPERLKDEFLRRRLHGAPIKSLLFEHPDRHHLSPKQMSRSATATTTAQAEKRASQGRGQMERTYLVIGLVLSSKDLP